MITTNIVTLNISQDKEQKHTVGFGFVNSFKTNVNCKTNAAVSKQSQYITTSACSCCNSFCETHSWYSNSWLAVVVFVGVKLCIYGQWMHLEYGHNRIVTDSPSRKVHNRTVYSWISYCKTSKIQYYKVYKCWVMIANNPSTSPHGLLLLHLVLQHMHGTVRTGWHLLFLLV